MATPSVFAATTGPAAEALALLRLSLLPRVVGEVLPNGVGGVPMVRPVGMQPFQGTPAGDMQAALGGDAALLLEDAVAAVKTAGVPNGTMDAGRAMPMASLVPMQNVVAVDKVAEYVRLLAGERMEGGVVTVADFRGATYLLDGHHRVSAMALLGHDTVLVSDYAIPETRSDDEDDALIRAVVAALRGDPRFNSNHDPKNGEFAEGSGGGDKGGGSGGGADTGSGDKGGSSSTASAAEKKAAIQALIAENEAYQKELVKAWGNNGAEGKMSPQYRSLDDYAGSLYGPINLTARGVTDDYKGVVLDDIKNLDEGFAKSPGIPRDVTVWRGMSARHLGGEGNIRSGTKIVDNGYVSTSRSASTAMGFALDRNDGVILGIHVPKGARAVDVEAVLGSSDVGESELLLPRGGTYTISGAPKVANVSGRSVEYYPVEYTPASAPPPVRSGATRAAGEGEASGGGLLERISDWSPETVEITLPGSAESNSDPAPAPPDPAAPPLEAPPAPAPAPEPAPPMPSLAEIHPDAKLPPMVKAIIAKFGQGSEA